MGMQKGETGHRLKVLRKQKGLTQKELSKNGKLDQICTARHLRKIENGEAEPTATVLGQLLSVMGVTVAQFTDMITHEKILDFNNAFSVVWGLMYDRKFVEAQEKLDKLREESYCDTTIPHIKQALLLCEGIIMRRLHGDVEKSDKILYEALKVTFAKLKADAQVYTKEEITAIEGKALSHNEYRILNLIGITRGERGQPEEWIKILKAMLASLHENKIDQEIRNRLLPTIYFNLTNALLETGQYQECIEVCDKGIAFCVEIKTSKTHGELIHNKGSALFRFGNVDAATDMFERSYNYFVHGGNMKAAEMAKDIAKKLCGIIISEG